ncbi:MAG: DEAD/DEAH box helicase [Candidatus Hodarchaeales archaeon]
MTSDQFYRLAPWIQEWIYRQQWEVFRPIQEEACKVIFDTPHHLLLATGTASGKTEAALFPILTLLDEKPSASIGVLYIGPLKALINDQFQRVEDLLQEADIHVWRWHGDVPQSHKAKLVRNPSGILQITPESLESLLINRTADLRKLFGDLRFIIIDEVHAFMPQLSDRGRQVICQLERLQEYTNQIPRRVGLSATLGDYSYTEQWLASGTNLPVVTPITDEPPKKLRLGIEHFTETTWYRAKMRGQPPPRGLDLPSHRWIFDLTLGRKCIIFQNDRERTELVTHGLREIAESKGLPDVYHSHHSCIAGLLREDAEEFLKKGNGTPHVVAATMTLELGIDISDVERIIHVDSPHAVSTFVQRLGRSGRVNNASEMLFAISENPKSNRTPLAYQVPWRLLQAIAVVQLYLDERWIEPALPLKKPFSILLHQTMSILASAGELSPQALAKRVLLLTPFKNITMAEFRVLLNHLIKNEYIEQIQDGGLILGLAGEKIVRNYRFYAVFRDYAVEYSIKEGTREIGHIEQLLEPGDQLLIGGYPYRITQVYPKQKVMLAEKITEKPFYVWPGRLAPVDTRVIQRMRLSLVEDKTYSFLQRAARLRLEEGRLFAKAQQFDRNVLLQESKNRYSLLPWMGSTPFRTLLRILKFLGPDTLGIRWLQPEPVTTTDPHLPVHVIRFETSSYNNVTSLYKDLYNLVESITEKELHQLYDQTEKFIYERYHHLLPIDLQREVLVHNYLDLNEVKRIIRTWEDFSVYWQNE